MPIAVILPAAGGDARAHLTAEALRRQRTAPVATVSSVVDALNAAGELTDEWIWLLEGGVVPKPGALQALLDVALRFERPPALLASTVLTPEGTLDRASAPVAEVRRAERVLDACEHGCVALRVARSGSLLVRAGALAGLDVKDTSLVDRDLQWTALLLRREWGVLVPNSVVIRSVRSTRVSPQRVLARLASSIGMLSKVEAADRPWFAYQLAAQGLASLIDPRRGER